MAVIQRPYVRERFGREIPLIDDVIREMEASGESVAIASIDPAKLAGTDSERMNFIAGYVACYARMSRTIEAHNLQEAMDAP